MPPGWGFSFLARLPFDGNCTRPVAIVLAVDGINPQLDRPLQAPY